MKHLSLTQYWSEGSTYSQSPRKIPEGKSSKGNTNISTRALHPGDRKDFGYASLRRKDEDTNISAGAMHRGGAKRGTQILRQGLSPLGEENISAGAMPPYG